MERAARIAMAEIAAYLDDHSEIERVAIAVHGDDAYRVHRDALGDRLVTALRLTQAPSRPRRQE
jgi:hypothetical protein